LAIAIGTLIEKKTKLGKGGKLDWSTKIKDIIHEWKLMNDYASEHADIIDMLCEHYGSHFLRRGTDSSSHAKWIAKA